MKSPGRPKAEGARQENGEGNNVREALAPHVIGVDYENMEAAYETERANEAVSECWAYPTN